MKKKIIVLTGSSGNGLYARCDYLKSEANFYLDVLWIDKKMGVDLIDGPNLYQNGKIYDLCSYDLVIYWPASFQNSRHRIGSKFDKQATTEYLSRCWSVLEFALFTEVSDLLLNPYQNAIAASNKAYVYLCARKMDIKVLASEISNYSLKSKIVKFKKTIVKTISDTVEVDDSYHFYTSLIDSNGEFDKYAECPVIIQDYVRALNEYKAYIFDREILIVKISRDDDRPDFRLLNENRLICRFEDNPQIYTAADSLRRFFNLNLFCADFIEDLEGNVYLLEINPHGSWHWLGEDLRNVLDAKYLRTIMNSISRVKSMQSDVAL